ncbi:MAG: peptidase M28 family protein, partial [Chthoniobacterales bacterium]|nr:peptidase M28 family protein [Chthoniobacterales bacterium]
MNARGAVSPHPTVRLLLGIWLATSSLAYAQQVTPTPSPSPSPTPTQFSSQTLSELKQLQQAALASEYAYRQVAYLSNNIGPRLSGSAQAQKAVDYVATELRALGLDVRTEKVMVPHWVRGEEVAALVEFPGQAANTTQKIVLTALGGSVATANDGL